MFRSFLLFCSISALFGAALPASAATITFETVCGGNPVAVTATSATCVYGDSTVSAAVNDSDLSHVTVTASISPPPTPPASVPVAASVLYDADLSITFMAPPGAPAGGSYTPCISGGPGDWAIAEFNGFSIFQGGGPNPSCSTFLLHASIGFTFGVPQVQHLRLSASAVMPGGIYRGDSYAALNGFRVYTNTGGQEIAGVEWIVTEVPEPALVVPMFVALAVIELETPTGYARTRCD